MNFIKSKFYSIISMMKKNFSQYCALKNTFFLRNKSKSKGLYKFTQRVKSPLKPVHRDQVVNTGKKSFTNEAYVKHFFFSPPIF